MLWVLVLRLLVGGGGCRSGGLSPPSKIAWSRGCLVWGVVVVVLLLCCSNPLALCSSRPHRKKGFDFKRAGLVATGIADFIQA